ncbi:TonB-dependent receptor plug domain-containing protein [Alteriqipengyuania lutimaris]|uniref:TonB-dependent receptor n=1 Tax=Alteriqipengyuania lutimaris TaxID=1538146 RepID=A0A395LKN8_9SPHN|nr:TonB-dependent receptor [Alteriqipengyuania lutimaris]MBB3033455.1 outer membrane receptor protein involved in Fe transport [Alteriqipengyuania lutimaris]RDS77528.1 TonB-dependent receptor [Alteriqipengyuania lutimaris]
MTNRFNKAALLTGTIMAGAMVATPAMAQGTPDEPALEATPDAENATTDEGLIVVTGSRIARRNIETAAPIAVVNSEEFELSGTVNVENVINTLPQVVPGTTSFSNNPGNGAATLNLRGLGSTRTLVLVNGRRYLSYDTNQIVDLNTIPSFLLDSVDVVTGGASAVYGSDALAGVVNFRLRDVVGAEVGGQYSITNRGDGARYEVHGAIGTEFADGRGNATVFAEYFNRESIFQGDRDFSFFALGGLNNAGTLVQGGSSLPPETRLTYQGNAPDAAVEATAFGANGLGIFGTPGSLRNYNAATDAYNYAPVNYLQLPQERYLLGGYADYEIGDGHEVYTEATFVNNRVASELAATPILVNIDLPIARVSQFLDAATVAQLNALDAAETGDQAGDGAVSVQVRRRLLETGGRNNLDERNAFRVLGGARGPLGSFLNYDAYYMYARTNNQQSQQGNASTSRFIDGLTGNLGTADPINIFGANTLTPAMVDSFSVNSTNGETSSIQVASGVLSGTFGDFAIGAQSDPIGFAFGGEYRKVAASYNPDTFLASGDVQGFNAGQPTSGGYDVRELFAELNVPIQFGSARLELNGAARYSDYSLDAVGGVWTYAGGVEFQPIPDIILRGQYQKATRAPNVAELFQGDAVNFPQAVDPCADENNAGNATIQALCVAQGVPAANLFQGEQSLVQPDAQIQTVVGGNPDLAEETSESYTAGVVFQPRFIPGLTITADYFNITIEDAISVLTLDQLFSLCFEQAQDLSDPRCDNVNVPRDAQGAYTRVSPPIQRGLNIAEFSVSGVDLEVSYGMAVPFSLFTDTNEQRLNLSFVGTWYDSALTKPDAGDPSVEIECAGYFASQCGEPTPEYKWTSRASFVDGPVTTSIRWRHLSGVEDEGRPDESIDAYDLVDLTFSFAASEKLTFNVGVNNLFDTLPGTPVYDAAGNVINDPNSLLLGANQEQANTFPSTYDVLGRDFFVSALLKF